MDCGNRGRFKRKIAKRERLTPRNTWLLLLQYFVMRYKTCLSSQKNFEEKHIKVSFPILSVVLSATMRFGLSVYSVLHQTKIIKHREPLPSRTAWRLVGCLYPLRHSLDLLSVYLVWPTDWQRARNLEFFTFFSRQSHEQRTNPTLGVFYFFEVLRTRPGSVALLYTSCLHAVRSFLYTQKG